MRIGIQTWGSEGDVRPLMALAIELSNAGHKVKLIATMPVEVNKYNEIAKKFDFELQYVATPIVKDLEELNNIRHSMIKESNPIKQGAIIMENFFYPVQNEMFSASIDLCKDSDLIIGHYILYPVHIAAEKFKVPNVSVTLSHNIIPSDFTLPTGVPDVGKWAYPLWWKLVRYLLNKSLLASVNDLRNKNALPKAKDIMLDVLPSKILNLIGVSPIFCRKQKDWGQNHQVCGFLNLAEKSDNEELPDSMKQFLNTGEPPVFMNFGSMMPLKSEERKKIFDLFKETAKLANCRIILQIYESEQDLFKSDNKTYYTPPVNHLKIFPYCSAVIHHGGAGTTQSATLSGVPSIVVSFISEQTFWGTELKRIGIAPDVINFNKLTSKKLANKIKSVLNSPHMKEKANEIGKEMKKEDGLKRAVELINDCFNK